MLFIFHSKWNIFQNAITNVIWLRVNMSNDCPTSFKNLKRFQSQFQFNYLNKHENLYLLKIIKLRKDIKFDDKTFTMK